MHFLRIPLIGEELKDQRSILVITGRGKWPNRLVEELLVSIATSQWERKLKFVVKPGKKWDNIMNLSLIDCWSTVQEKTLQRSQQTDLWNFNSLFRNMNLAWRVVTFEDKKVCGSTQRIWLTKTYSGFTVIIGFSDFRITNFDVQILERFFQLSGGRTQF